jgi:hypothetical protein
MWLFSFRSKVLCPGTRKVKHDCCCFLYPMSVGPQFALHSGETQAVLYFDWVPDVMRDTRWLTKDRPASRKMCLIFLDLNHEEVFRDNRRRCTLNVLPDSSCSICPYMYEGKETNIYLGPCTSGSMLGTSTYLSCLIITIDKGAIYLESSFSR